MPSGLGETKKIAFYSSKPDENKEAEKAGVDYILTE